MSSTFNPLRFCSQSLLLLLMVVVVLPVHAEDKLTFKLPDNRTITGKLMLLEPFNRRDAWEAYSSPKGVELGTENGIYRMFTLNEGYVWGLNQQEHTNVILEVDVTPLSTDAASSAFGVICRADKANDGDGYYFMIKGDGYYSISMGAGDTITPLVEWQPSKAIHAGIDKNRVRVICIDDALALYVNDQLLIETRDSTYSNGYAGLSIAASPNSSSDVAFDNMAIYSVNPP